MIYRRQGKMIGKLDGGTYRKTVQKSKHLMRANQSFGIQEAVLKELRDEIRIEIFEKEEKIVYVTTAKEFRENCTYLQFGDFGLQGFLPLEKFTKESPTASVLLAPTWN